jgi:hypothetical protein
VIVFVGCSLKVDHVIDWAAFAKACAVRTFVRMSNNK